MIYIDINVCKKHRHLLLVLKKKVKIVNKQYDECINSKIFSVARFKKEKEYDKELVKAYALSKIAKELIKRIG